MRRGTRVGQAYVAVTADGSGINKEIVDSVDEAGPGVEKAGHEHGEGYSDEFGEALEGKLGPLMEKLGDTLSRRLSRRVGDGINKMVSDDSAKGIGSRLGDKIGAAISESIGEKLEGRFAALADDLEDKLNAVSGNAGGGGSSGSRLFPPRSADDRVLEAAHRMNEAFDRKRVLNLVEARRMDLAFDRKRTVLLAQAYRMNTQFDQGKLTGDGQAIRGGGSGGSGDGFDVSRLFGRGSRNNALNLFGGVIGGLTKLLTLGTTMTTKFVSTFVKGFQNAAEGASFFQKVLSGASGTISGGGAALAGMARALPALAVAFIGVSFVAVGLTSVLGALLAIVIALSASIATALVGALAVGAAAFGAVAVAGGLLTAAFMSMTDAQKNLLSDAFVPLKEEMVGIGQIMLQEMVPAFATWSTNLQAALHLLAPVAQQMGSAFAQAGNLLTAALSGPGFQQLSVALGTFLPSIITRLSSALGGFLNGAAGLFAMLLPYVNQFAAWLDRVATRFSDWTTSAQGRNSIADFMDRAVQSMKSVWNFAKELGGVLTDLLFNPYAQGAGNSIFDSMADGLRNLRKHIRNGDLKRWFEDAVEFSRKLGKAIVSVSKGFEKMYDSGVIDQIGDLIIGLGETFEFLAGAAGKIVDFFQNDFVQVVTGIINPVWGVIQAIDALAGGLFDVEGAADGAAFSLDRVNQALDGGAMDLLSGGLLGGFPGGGTGGTTGWGMTGPTVDDLIESGHNALNQTSESNGGYMPDKPEWVNPYIDWANSLMDSGPSIAAQIREAIRSVSKQVGSALKDIALLANQGEARDALKSLRESMDATAKDIVESAQQGLNSAASALASAGSPAEVQRALRQVHTAQAAVREAERQQKVLERLSDRLGKQQKSSSGRVGRLLEGLHVQNATLADFAAARGRLTQKLEQANQKLTEAISLRAQYRAQIRDSINSFGALTTAQASMIDGVEQALTAGDITTNLEDRLAKIKKFQANLQLLLAQGLSNDAYKQILDQGVEGGSLFAEALLAGGTGAIQDVNNLVGQVNDIAKQLGIEASDRMYKAGVEAARGLIDGLEALSDKLDRAATRLGNSIADAIKRALGIKSPSRVMMATMDDVGDGTEKGLDNQHRKVGRAATRLSKQIAVSPEVANYAARQQTPQVSGNEDGSRFLWTGDIVTPTEDPHAVANEVLNELTGRL